MQVNDLKILFDTAFKSASEIRFKRMWVHG